MIASLAPTTSSAMPPGHRASEQKKSAFYIDLNVNAGHGLKQPLIQAELSSPAPPPSEDARQDHHHSSLSHSAGPAFIDLDDIAAFALLTILPWRAGFSAIGARAWRASMRGHLSKAQALAAERSPAAQSANSSHGRPFASFPLNASGEYRTEAIFHHYQSEMRVPDSGRGHIIASLSFDSGMTLMPFLEGAHVSRCHTARGREPSADAARWRANIFR